MVFYFQIFNSYLWSIPACPWIPKQKIVVVYNAYWINYKIYKKSPPLSTSRVEVVFTIHVGYCKPKRWSSQVLMYEFLCVFCITTFIYLFIYYHHSFYYFMEVVLGLIFGIFLAKHNPKKFSSLHNKASNFVHNTFPLRTSYTSWKSFLKIVYIFCTTTLNNKILVRGGTMCDNASFLCEHNPKWNVILCTMKLQKLIHNTLSLQTPLLLKMLDEIRSNLLHKNFTSKIRFGDCTLFSLPTFILFDYVLKIF